MASLTHVLERMQKKEKPLWHLHRSSEIESVDELQFASGRWMKPIQHFPKPKTEERQKSRQTPSTAVIPTVAIHRGNHGTYEPARTTIEQNSRQQTTKQVVVRKLRIPHPTDRIRGNDGQDEAIPTLQASNRTPRRPDPMERRHQDCNLRRTQPQEQSPTWRRHAPT